MPVIHGACIWHTWYVSTHRYTHTRWGYIYIYVSVFAIYGICICLIYQIDDMWRLYGILVCVHMFTWRIRYILYDGIGVGGCSTIGEDECNGTGQGICPSHVVQHARSRWQKHGRLSYAHLESYTHLHTVSGACIHICMYSIYGISAYTI